MPKMDFSNIEKYCLECNNKLKIKINRDIQRKKFCCNDFKVGNLLIYADGDYWHSLPKRLKKDQEQNIKLTNLGYSVIRFLGSMIKKEPEKVKEKIINELCRIKKY